MTPDVVVDIGNTRMKWGLCEGGRVTQIAVLKHDDPVAWKRQAEQWGMNGPARRWAIASVVPEVTWRFGAWLTSRDELVFLTTITSELFADEQLELETTVDEPERVGVDRLLGSLAAIMLMPSEMEASAVVISVGTAMTVDFIEPFATHVGGVILPGPELMARSLHEHTAKLPHISIDPVLPLEIWGTNTEDAIQLGIANAILGAADQLVWDWAARSSAPPWVFATGGDVGYFRGFKFTADLGGFVIEPKLTLEGIRIAAEALP